MSETTAKNSKMSRKFMTRKNARKSKIRRETEGAIKKGADATKATTKTTKTTKEPPKPRQTEHEIDENISHMDVRLLADLMGQKIKRHHKDLTAIELNEMYLPTSAFRDTSEFASKRDLEALPAYLKQFTAGGKDALLSTTEETGNPHTIFISSSGIRAADLSRAVREFQTKEIMVAKLFAKHIKLDEAIKHMSKTRVNIGIGTPGRINDLLNADALKTSNLARIVIDGSYIDQKKRTIFDMKDVFDPLLDILRRPELIERYGADENKIEIMVY